MGRRSLTGVVGVFAVDGGSSVVGGGLVEAPYCTRFPQW
jgi:hypothetical protein